MKKGFLYTIIGAVSWGFSGSMGQHLFEAYHVNAPWLVSVRMIFAGIILCIVSMMTMPHATRNLLKSKKDMAVEIVFALAGLAFVQLAYLTTIRLSNAATATVLQNLNPVMIMIFVCLTHRKLPTLVEFICIILAIAGTLALFFGLLTAFACCVYTILPVQLMKKFGSMPVIGIGMLVGGIIMTLFVQSWKLYVPLDFAGWLGVILMVVVGTAFAFTFFLTGVKEIGPVYGSIIGSLEPLTAAILGLVWLHTPLSWIDGVGFVMIMITVFLLSAPKRTHS
ncbi:DMT family transporter [uncultured Sharpea sp.]|uniref:DMT family transporter n=1 Tax=uncultured Sharpea sp. TaxID=1112738 RepID=UPI00258A0E1B|nr:EamA family transporter [uncultured Sharpea sp.]